MQTELSPEFAGTPDGLAAQALLRKCVHCGFCTATCPTYQLLGDELDGPRGRIYQIKQVLEGEPATRSVQQHLDRCLTCRNCETTCPSGVQYGELIDLGRRIVDERVERPTMEKVQRWLLKEGVTSPLFAPAMTLGKLVRPLLPPALKAKVPASAAASGAWPTRTHARQMLMLAGCVQPSMSPNINLATARVLDACGIQPVIAADAGCCGAIRAHLNDHHGGLADMRRNIDAWWPLIEPTDGARPVEALVMNASGCGATVKDYGHHLADDPAYAAKAARVSALTRDLSELLPELLPTLKTRLAESAARQNGPLPKLALHPPCTLQHAQKLRGGLEAALRELGFEVSLPAESHLCCGSAGTYSVLQPELSKQLRDRKLANIAPLQADVIVSANIGCITHLQSGCQTPVRHWVEVLENRLA
ncbi:MAG: glycolate oxidase subunit GlcF [Leptothrix sp. (in: b-proteobacteria)]